MKSWMLIILLAAVAIAPAVFFWYSSQRIAASINFDATLQAGDTFNVKACKVVDGSRYEMYLEDGQWIKACLSVFAKDEAAPVVSRWLTSSFQPCPTVTLLKKVDDCWIVDFQITMNSERISMNDLLQKKELLLK